MKRLLFFLVVALAVGVLSYAIYSETRTPAEPALLGEERGLAWLRSEFDLSEAQFEEISRLHAEYQPVCRALCNEVIAAQERLDTAIRDAGDLSRQLEEELQNFSQVKEQCHRAMLRHAYQVAEHLPSRDRPRYLSAVGSQITRHGHGH